MAETTAKYRVLIPVELGTAGVRSGERELDSFYARLEKRAAEAAKKIEEAFKRAGGALPSSGGGSGSRGPSGGTTRAMDDHVKQFKAMEREAARSAGEVRRINEQTRRQGEAQDRLLEGSARRLASVRTREAKRAADDFLRLLHETTRAEKQAASERERAARSGGFFKSASPIAAGVFGGLGIASLTSDLIDGGRALLSYSARLEQTRIGFTTLTGSVELANKHIRDLQEFAQKTPFQFEDVLTASRRFHAMGYETERIIPLLGAMGDAIAAVGGRAESINQVSRAFAQIYAKGRLQAEEANQIADATDGAVNAYAILAKQLGVTQAKAREMGEQGKITAEIFLDAFQAFAKENFGGAMEKQSRTFLGAWNNIIDTLQIKGAVAFEPFFKSVSELTDRTAREIEKQDFEGAIATIFENAFKSAGEGAGDAVISLVDELFGRAKKRADENIKNFSFHNLGASFAEGLFGLAPNQTIFDKMFGDSKSVSEARRLMTEVVDFGNAMRVDPKTLRQPGRQPNLTLKDDPKLLERQQGLLEDLRREIQFFGDNSAVAATKQKLLAAGVTDLNSGLASQAIQLAAAVDRMRDAADVAELVQKKLKEAGDFQKDLKKQLEESARLATRRALDLENEMLGFEPSERFKFDLSELGQTAGGIKDIQNELNEARAAWNRYDTAAANVKPFRERKKATDELTASLKQLWDSLEGITEDFESRVRGTRYVGGRRSPIDELFDSLSGLKELRDLGLPKAAFDQIHSFIAAMGELDPKEVDTLRTSIYALLLTSVPADVGIQKVAVYTEKVIEAIRGAQRATDVLTPLQSARESLEAQLIDSQQAIGVSAETASLRYQLAWQDAFNEVALADDAARLSMIRSQVQLADQTIFHADRANSAVLEYLASQRSVTDVIADFRINTIDTTFSLIDRGLERFTSRLGIIGGLVRDLISGFARIALSRFFQGIYGGGTASGQPGGDFSFGSLLGNIFGGGGQAGSPSFAFAGMGASSFASSPAFGSGSAAAFTRNFFGGGIDAPASLTQLAGSNGFASLSPDIRRQLSLAALDMPNSGGGLSRLFGNVRGSLSSLAPMLGLGLGAGLGGSSLGGNILGGAGGALGGLLASGLISGGGLGGLVGGQAGNLLGFLGLGTGVLGAATLGIGAVAALVGAWAAGRSRQRREDETVRDVLSNDTGTAIWQLIGQAQRGQLGVEEARQQFNAIKQRYFDGIAQLKDSKSRRIAAETWNHFQALWPILEQNAKQSDEARARSQRLIPSFATGGVVPNLSLIKVQAGERVLPPHVQQSLRRHGGFIPGTNRGVDDTYMMAEPGTVIQPVRAYAAGGVVDSAAPLESRLSGLTINVTNNFKDGIEQTAIEILDEHGERVVLEALNSRSVKRELHEQTLNSVGSGIRMRDERVRR